MAQDANARSKLEYPLPGALYSTLIDRATAGFLGLVTTVRDRCLWNKQRGFVL